MAYAPNDQEVNSVLALHADERYAHWIKQVASWERVWGLWKDGGWAVVGDDAGGELLPVWPHAKYAALCANGIWQGYEPKAIPLDAWMSRWIPGLEQDHRRIAVFPTPGGKGIAVDARRVEMELKEELEQYE